MWWLATALAADPDAQPTAPGGGERQDEASFDELALWLQSATRGEGVQDWTPPELLGDDRPTRRHCQVLVRIGEDGRAERVDALAECSSGRLRRTERRVREMRFRPLTLEHEPVSSEVLLSPTQGAWLISTPPRSTFCELTSLDGEVHEVHWSQVRPVVAAAPPYPREAKEEGIEGDCKVRVYIDEQGHPYGVYLESCPEPFREEATRAVERSRYVPLKVGGEPAKAQFVYVFKFKL